MHKKTIGISVLLVILISCAFTPHALSAYRPGAIYASINRDQDSIIAQIDPITGERSIVSSPTIGLGPEIDWIMGLTGDSEGNFYASCRMVGDLGPATTVVRIEAATGNRTIISSNSVGTGILNVNAPYLHWQDGVLYAGDIANDALLSINITNGNRTVISKSSIAQGPQVGSGAIIPWIMGIRVDINGQVLVSDRVAMSIVRIDPNTGNRTLVSKDGERGTGLDFESPIGLVIDPVDQSLIIGEPDRGLMQRVDPDSGDRSIIYMEGMPGGVAPFFAPSAIDIEPDGTLVIFERAQNNLLRYDLSNNSQSVISNFFPGNIGAGPVLDQPSDIFVVPIPEPSSIAISALVMFQFVGRRGRVFQRRHG
jgi:hypothetical protein